MSSMMAANKDSNSALREMLAANFGDEGDDNQFNQLSDAEGRKRGATLMHMLNDSTPQARKQETRTKLTSNAALFVPSGMGNAPAPKIDSATELSDVIRQTFGEALQDMSTTVTESFTALNLSLWFAPMYFGLMDQQCLQWQAMQALVDAFGCLGCKIYQTEKSDDNTWLRIEYLNVLSTSNLCWEFVHNGACPRNARCRWEHASLEVFTINLYVQAQTSQETQVAPAPVPFIAPAQFQQESNLQAVACAPCNLWQPPAQTSYTPVQDELLGPEFLSLGEARASNSQQEARFAGDMRLPVGKIGSMGEMTCSTTPTTPASSPYTRSMPKTTFGSFSEEDLVEKEKTVPGVRGLPLQTLRSTDAQGRALWADLEDDDELE